LGERKPRLARTQGAAFAGGKGKPEDVARRRFAADPSAAVFAAVST
jgi:hypothetical protein